MVFMNERILSVAPLGGSYTMYEIKVELRRYFYAAGELASDWVPGIIYFKDDLPEEDRTEGHCFHMIDEAVAEYCQLQGLGSYCRAFSYSICREAGVYGPRR